MLNALCILLNVIMAIRQQKIRFYQTSIKRVRVPKVRDLCSSFFFQLFSMLLRVNLPINNSIFPILLAEMATEDTIWFYVTQILILLRHPIVYLFEIHSISEMVLYFLIDFLECSSSKFKKLFVHVRKIFLFDRSLYSTRDGTGTRFSRDLRFFLVSGIYRYVFDFKLNPYPNTGFPAFLPVIVFFISFFDFSGLYILLIHYSNFISKSAKLYDMLHIYFAAFATISSSH